jgi:hypothetical protein
MLEAADGIPTGRGSKALHRDAGRRTPRPGRTGGAELRVLPYPHGREGESPPPMASQ